MSNTIYEAIMKAAHTLESDPRLWDWWSGFVPASCGTPGCALGWIGFHLGQKKGAGFYSQEAIGVDSFEFYQRMRQISPEGAWKKSGKTAAAALRLYAEKYHAPVITGLPDSVREIFTNPRQTISDTAPDQRFARSL